MSSSFRKSTRPRFVVASAVVIAAAVAPTSASWGAQTYVQPQFSLQVEDNDNLDLTPGGSSDSDVYGYIADAQALIGIATPRGETSVRPRLRLQEYPDRDDLERLEAFLDVNSRYRWERSDLRVVGRYSRQDTYNADTPSGEFDPLDPNFGNNPDSVRILVGETRDWYELRPTLSYAVTERASIGGTVGYQIVRYDADGAPANIDYDYATLEGFTKWALNPVSDVAVSAYASKYEAQDDSNDTDAYGGRLGYDYRWSDVTGIQAIAFYEQNDITSFDPVRSEESTSGWGGMLTAYRKLEVSEWRLTIGQTFIPTGDGGKSESDQARVQYDRDLSERLAFRGAARYESRTPLTETGGGDDRDFARVDLSLEYFMTPTWFVRGGYSYIWRDIESEPESADNNKLFLSVGYRGLGRQQR